MEEDHEKTQDNGVLAEICTEHIQITVTSTPNCSANVDSDDSFLQHEYVYIRGGWATTGPCTATITDLL
jgi:hypothetical protein